MTFQNQIYKTSKRSFRRTLLEVCEIRKPAFLSEILTGQSIVSGTRSYGSVGFRAKRKIVMLYLLQDLLPQDTLYKSWNLCIRNESMSTPIGCAEISQTSGDTDAAFVIQ